MNNHFAKRLLNWYDQYGRKDLPWQENKIPYRVWVSEIMLQQTQVKTVIPYYQRFIQRFPTIKSLADAEQDEVLQLWTGLGYYARARNLHKTAQIINNELSEFPQTLEQIQALPGIGRSTAGAILSLTGQQRQPILDGNVKRTLSRYFLIEGWAGKASVLKELWEYAEKITPEKRYSEFNQALMDLGSGLCSRSKPQCLSCPLQNSCKAFQQHLTEHYPAPRPRKKIPEKSAYFLILSIADSKLLFEKRPPHGLWGGLWTFPQFNQESEIQHWMDRHKLVCKGEYHFWPSFKHTFSHYQLYIHPVYIEVKETSAIMNRDDLTWCDIKKSLKFGVPAPISKLVSRILNNY
jgi:A/G-specific adenine glycosylase